jgi:hypothetical protein
MALDGLIHVHLVLVTSTPVECVFSQGHQLLHFTHNRLSPVLIEASLCFGDWSCKNMVSMSDIIDGILHKGKNKRVVNEVLSYGETWIHLLYTIMDQLMFYLRFWCPVCVVFYSVNTPWYKNKTCSTNPHLYTPYLLQVQCNRWQVQCDPKSPTVSPMLHPKDYTSHSISIHSYQPWASPYQPWTIPSHPAKRVHMSQLDGWRQDPPDQFHSRPPSWGCQWTQLQDSYPGMQLLLKCSSTKWKGLSKLKTLLACKNKFSMVFHLNVMCLPTDTFF